MLEFEILARGLFRPHALDIVYDPSLRMPTEGLQEDIGVVGEAGVNRTGLAPVLRTSPISPSRNG